MYIYSAHSLKQFVFLVLSGWGWLVMDTLSHRILATATGGKPYTVLLHGDGDAGCFSQYIFIEIISSTISDD
jgi:hypothetical protein